MMDCFSNGLRNSGIVYRLGAVKDKYTHESEENDGKEDKELMNETFDTVNEIFIFI